MIEAGCTAMVIKSQSAGKIVQVGNYIGQFEDFKSEKNWEINISIHYIDGKYYNIIREDYLQRIDDPITEKSKQKENEVQ